MKLTDIHKQNAKRRFLWLGFLIFGEIGIFVFSHEIGYQAYRTLYGSPKPDLSWGLYIYYFLYLYIGVVIVVGLAGMLIRSGAIAYYIAIEFLALSYFALAQICHRPYRSLLLFTSMLAGIIFPWLIVSFILRRRGS